MHPRIVVIQQPSIVDPEQILADMEREYTEAAAWRLSESLFAHKRWRLMRQGHSMVLAHTLAVAGLAERAA